LLFLSWQQNYVAPGNDPYLSSYYGTSFPLLFQKLLEKKQNKTKKKLTWTQKQTTTKKIEIKLLRSKTTTKRKKTITSQVNFWIWIFEFLKKKKQLYILPAPSLRQSETTLTSVKWNTWNDQWIEIIWNL